jgi:hypothetical protein
MVIHALAGVAAASGKCFEITSHNDEDGGTELNLVGWQLVSLVCWQEGWKCMTATVEPIKSGRLNTTSWSAKRAAASLSLYAISKTDVLIPETDVRSCVLPDFSPCNWRWSVNKCSSTFRST